MSGALSPTLHSPSAEKIRDLELQRQPTTPRRVSHWQLVKSHALVTDEVAAHHYEGAGTEDDAYLVQFIPYDPRDPNQFPG